MQNKRILELIENLVKDGLNTNDSLTVISYYGYKGYGITINQNGKEIINEIVKILNSKLIKKNSINKEGIRKLFLNWLIENLS